MIVVVYCHVSDVYADLCTACPHGLGVVSAMAVMAATAVLLEKAMVNIFTNE